MAELTPSRKRWFLIVLVLLPIVIPIAIAESYLRIQGAYATYSEKIGSGYVSYYNQKYQDQLWRYSPNAELVIDHGEFRYVYQTNELGICESRSFDPNDTSIFRIITLGDSFTEGMGAPADSAWPRAMEEKLNGLLGRSSKKVQVYNAGVSGSDPFLNYMMLKKHLIGFKPDLVIQSFNTSDLSDFLYRGGMERYHDGIMQFRKGPWWEIIYRFSHITRLIVHGHLGYDPMLVKEEDRIRIYDEAVVAYHKLITDMYQPMADSCGFQTIYLLQPMSDELRYDCCNFEYLSTLDSLIKEDGKTGLDMFYPMQQVIGKDEDQHYYWPNDRHYNSNGYAVLGNLMADTVLQITELETYE